jgi:hypothetical protein
MSFIFDQGLQALAEGEGSWWLGSFPEDVMASFAINYPAHWADTSYPPVFSPPPVPASTNSRTTSTSRRLAPWSTWRTRSP